MRAQRLAHESLVMAEVCLVRRVGPRSVEKDHPGVERGRHDGERTRLIVHELGRQPHAPESDSRRRRHRAIMPASKRRVELDAHELIGMAEVEIRRRACDPITLQLEAMAVEVVVDPYRRLLPECVHFGDEARILAARR